MASENGIKNLNEGRIIVGPPLRLPTADSRGLGRLLFEKLQEHGDNIMQIDSASGEEETFNSFFTRSIRVAIHMSLKGFKTQDKILICTNNSLDSALPLIASFFLGVIPSTICPSLAFGEFKHFIGMMEPKAIFVCPEALHSVTRTLTHLEMDSIIVVYGSSDVYESLDDYLKPVKDEELFQPFHALSCIETAMILFSSGTTGKPKGICLSHGYSACFAFLINKSKDDTTILFSSLYAPTQVMTTIANIIYGFTKIVCQKYDSASTFCQIVNKYQVKFALFTTPVLVDLTEYCKKNQITLPLRNIFCGGTPLTHKQIISAKETLQNTNINNSYGQTEVGFVTSYGKPKNFTRQMEEKLLKVSCGKPVPGMLIKVIDLETRKLLGPHQKGEIKARGIYMMNGYYHVHVVDDVYDDEGWISTGDIGYYDEDGFIYIVDRIRQVLKYKGFPISPSFLEEVLSSHPAVKMALVTGIPHELDGDLPIAFILPEEDYTIDPEEIHKFVSKQVNDRMKLRGGIKIIDKIPLTPSGKPRRNQLRDMVLNGQL